MEKVSLGKADSGNWAVDYRPSNIVNPDLMKKPSQNEGSTSAPKMESTGQNEQIGKPGDQKELLSEAERKKREAQQAEKREEEWKNQQKLLQKFYAEKAGIDLSPEQKKEIQAALAERSIERLMKQEGSSLKVEWKSELHNINMTISMEAYDKLNEDSDSELLFAAVR